MGICHRRVRGPGHALAGQGTCPQSNRCRSRGRPSRLPTRGGGPM